MKLKAKKLQQKGQGKKIKDQKEEQNIWEIVIEGLNWKQKKTSIKGIRTK
jgi:hypothetical protein